MKTLQYLPPNKQWFNPKDWVDYKTFDMSVPDVDIFKMVGLSLSVSWRVLRR